MAAFLLVFSRRLPLIDLSNETDFKPPSIYEI